MPKPLVGLAAGLVVGLAAPPLLRRAARAVHALSATTVRVEHARR